MDDKDAFIRFISVAKFNSLCQRYDLNESWVDPLHSLSFLEFMSILIYTSSGDDFYRRINQALKNNSTSLDDTLIIKYLDSALKKIPIFKGDIFRGISLNKSMNELKNEYFVGSEHIWSSFTSCSPFMEGAYKGNVVFVIEASQGRNLQFYTDGGEDEILLPRNLCYKVTELLVKEDLFTARMVQL